MTEMRVMLLVMDVNMMRECENAGVGYGGDVVAVSAGHEYVGGTWFRYCDRRS